MSVLKRPSQQCHSTLAVTDPHGGSLDGYDAGKALANLR